MTTPTYLVDDTEVAARAAEVPNADFTNGCNIGASCAHGVGINYGGGAVEGTPNQFTLLDQDGNVRSPQASSIIGGSSEAIRAGTVSADGDGSVTEVAEVSLNDIATGWEAEVV